MLKNFHHILKNFHHIDVTITLDPRGNMYDVSVATRATIDDRWQYTYLGKAPTAMEALARIDDFLRGLPNVCPSCRKPLDE